MMIDKEKSKEIKEDALNDLKNHDKFVIALIGEEKDTLFSCCYTEDLLNVAIGLVNNAFKNYISEAVRLNFIAQIDKAINQEPEEDEEEE